MRTLSRNFYGSAYLTQVEIFSRVIGISSIFNVESREHVFLPRLDLLHGTLQRFPAGRSVFWDTEEYIRRYTRLYLRRPFELLTLSPRG